MFAGVRRHPASVFLAAAVGIGWIVTALSAQLPTSSVLLPFVAIPVSYVPAIVAWGVLRVAGSPDERAAFRRRLITVRVGWRWLVVALVLPAVHLAGVELAALFGGSISIHPAMLALLPLFLLTNFGEEIGWRGYALPKLQERWSPLAASIVLGLAWAAFHWVALLGNREAPLGYVAISSVQLVAMSLILAFVFNNAREAVPVVALVHALYDTVAIGVAPLVETGVPLLAFGLSAVLTTVVAAAIVTTGSSLSLVRRPANQPAALGAAE